MACQGLTPLTRAPPSPLPHGATLHLEPEGMLELARRLLERDESLGSLRVLLDEGFLADGKDGGLLTYGPEEWSLPVELSFLQPAADSIGLRVELGAGQRSMMLIHRPRFLPLRRCSIELSWSEVAMDLELVVLTGPDGLPGLQARDLSLRISEPLVELDPLCTRAGIAQSTIDTLAGVMAGALEQALRSHGQPLGDGLARAFGLKTRASGELKPGPPVDGVLALDLQAGGVSGTDGPSLLQLSSRGLTLPFRLGIEARSPGRCSPPRSVGPGSPSGPPAFPPPGSASEQGFAITLALSGELLAQTVGAVMEAGFPCRPMRGKEMSELRVGRFGLPAALARVAPRDASLTLLLRPGEGAELQLGTGLTAFRLAIRRVALDLYLHLDMTDLRGLAATADLDMELGLESEPGGELYLQPRPGRVHVQPRWVSSELLSPEENQALPDTLDELYAQALDLALRTTLSLPAPALDRVVLRIGSVSRAGDFLYLSLVPM